MPFLGLSLKKQLHALLHQCGGQSAKLSWKVAVREQNSHNLKSHLLREGFSKNLLVIGQEPCRELLLGLTNSHRSWLKQGHGHQNSIDRARRAEATTQTGVQLLCCRMFLLLFLGVIGSF